MRIGIDIDGCLADFNHQYIARCISVTNKDLFPLRPFDIKVWSYPESYGYTTEEVSAVWDSIIADPKFWQNLFPYSTTQADIAALNDRVINFHDDVYFITSRPGIHAKIQTERWLKNNGFRPTATVLISSRKGACAKALNLNRYVDDKTENVIDVSLVEGTKTFLLDRPWNDSLRCNDYDITRISSIVEMFD